MEDETSSDASVMQASGTTEMVTPRATGVIPETEQPPQAQSADDAQKELEKLRTALKKANADASSHRKKADELDKLKADQEAASLSETEKLQKQLAKLQADHEQANKTLQERTLNYEVRLHAAQLGIADPNDAVALLNHSLIEYDESGAPKNVDDLLKALLKAKPYLAGKPVTASSGGATNPPRSQTGGDSVENLVARLQQGQLSNAEYGALPVHVRSQIQAALQKRTHLGSRPV